jgi:putative transposase
MVVLLSRGFAWKEALVTITPKTFIGWHRVGFRLFWRCKCRTERPRIPPELRALIREMARDNVSWVEERIANELLLKLGIQLSPRTVRKHTPKRPRGQSRGDQRWSTFVRNHAKAIVACDFLTMVTATLKILHVLVIIELGTQKLLYINVTYHPSADWSRQQLREAIPSDYTYKYLIHERECLDFLIPILRKWVKRYNQGRPHSSIGPGIPDPPTELPVPPQGHRHRIPSHLKVVAYPILGGLYHEYRLYLKAA